MSKPQVIEDEEHERVFERVAAVDVAKAAGVVCVRAPHPWRPGMRRSTVWTVQATMTGVLELAGRLAAETAGQPGIARTRKSAQPNTSGQQIIGAKDRG